MLKPEDLVKFDWTVNVYTIAGTIEIEQYCNSILAVNIAAVGGPLATINKFPMNARLVAGANGESFAIGGNAGEVMTRQELDLAFPNGAAGGIVLVVQKFYIFPKC